LYDAGFRTIDQLFDEDMFNETSLIKSGLFVRGRALEIILNAPKKVKKIPIHKIIQSFKFKDVGESVSKQVAKFWLNQEYDSKGLNRAAFRLMTSNSEESKIAKRFINKLKNSGIKIIIPQPPSADSRIYEMTGSPKGISDTIKTKNDYIKFLSDKGFSKGKLKDSDYLITNSMDSTSNKMDEARKRGVEIITYEDLYKKLKNA
jgi:NAD-dependent DNA ligase